MILDRDRKADPYPVLEWKVRLFILGAGLGVGGMLLEVWWLIPLAVVVLAAGVLLRFLPAGKGTPVAGGDEAGQDR